MANTRYEDLLPFVLPEVHGCSDPLAEQAIREAVIEFCQQSRVWIYLCDPVDAVAAQPNYDIDLPTDASLVEIFAIRINGVLLTPASIDSLDQECRDWMTETGAPRNYAQFNDDEFYCYPAPVAASIGDIKVRLIVKPSQSSSGFPAWINERYQRGIVAGAKSLLMMKQGTAWYNPGAAGAYDIAFHDAWAGAREEAAHSLVRAVTRVTPQN